jgi:hypothetical protein
MRHPGRHLTHFAICLLSAVALARGAIAQPPPDNTLAGFVDSVRRKARGLEKTSGMRLAFRSFTLAHGLSSDSVSYSKFTIVRLLFESTRDAGLWNIQWKITDLPPNSDNIWKQWEHARRPSLSAPTATAECDEISALFAFLARRAGVKDIGLLWPTSNHTVAAWTVRPAGKPEVCVVVPTTQIFLEETDFFGTRKFDPWRQRTIYEYTRRDALDSFVFPAPLRGPAFRARHAVRLTTLAVESPELTRLLPRGRL